VINSVEPDRPAARAGLQTGDVVRRVNGEPVVSSADLPAVVGMLPPGERVTLEVWRDGRIREITAELGSMDRGAPQADAGGAGGDDDPKLGLTVQPLPSGQARAGEDGGLLVRRVAGPAARAGILPGDVVLRVNGAEVDSVDDVRQALEGAGDTVALLIRRGEARIFVPVRVG
jgi:serine protease Do